jgi:hypothetical protein
LFGMLYSKMNNICNTCVGNLEHLYWTSEAPRLNILNTCVDHLNTCIDHLEQQSWTSGTPVLSIWNTCVIICIETTLTKPSHTQKSIL